MAAGCSSSRPVEVPAERTQVDVSHPLRQQVSDYAEFTGRISAVEAVEVRARVWGYLQKVNFKEGTLVKKGDVLFEIDPRTYQSAREQSEAKVALDEAQLRYKQASHRRNEKLRTDKSVSQEEFDKSLAEQEMAAATLGADQADLELRKLDLDFTKVLAPISGRVGRALVTEGNLVQSGQTGGTLLTTIVSVDPVYAYFDVDELTVLRVRRLIREGKARSARDTEVAVWMGLANEGAFPHRGIIDFVDNQVNPKTGTLRARGVFPNKDEALVPGLFTHVRVGIGEPHEALLITERAIQTDLGQKVVYVVDEQDRVVSRPIELGARHDGLRAIESGLNTSDRVIVRGLQRVRPGATVEPREVEMPSSAPAQEQPDSQKQPESMSAAGGAKQ